MDDDGNRITAAVAMIERLGGEEFQIRYCEEEQPVVWMAMARWGGHWEAAGAMTPWRALFRLLETLMDGGTCRHCHKTTGVDEEPANPLKDFMDPVVCWYRYDPEVKTFRRSCEGVA